MAGSTGVWHGREHVHGTTLRDLALFVAVVLLLQLAALPSPASAADDEPAVRALLEQLVEHGVPGLAAGIRSEDGQWRAAVGVARLDPPLSMRPSARFRIGSVTKTFVATVVLQLAGEEILRLDDTLESRLPGTGIPNAEQITLRQLLNHTAGVFNYTEDAGVWTGEYADFSEYLPPEALVAIAADHPPSFPPGEGWRYSNTGYILLGLVVEAATGRPLETELRDRIFEPLDLDDTSFPDDPPISGYHANGYEPEGTDPANPAPPPPDAPLIDVTEWSPSWAWAAGGMVSEQRDIERFYRALLRGRLLRPALLDEMLTMVPLSPATGYGLGIGEVRSPCGTVVGHSGGVPGYVNAAYFSEDGRRSVTMMSNLPPFTQPQGELFDLALMTAVCQMYGAPEPADRVSTATVFLTPGAIWTAARP